MNLPYVEVLHDKTDEFKGGREISSPRKTIFEAVAVADHFNKHTQYTQSVARAVWIDVEGTNA